MIAKHLDLGFRPRNAEQVDFIDVDLDEMNDTYDLDDMSNDDKNEYLRKNAEQEDLLFLFLFLFL